MERTGLTGRGVALASAGVAAYFLSALLGIRYSPSSGSVASVWPAAGVQLAVLLLAGRGSRMPLAAALFAANVAANLLSGKPAGASLGFGLANISEGLLAAWLVERFRGPELRFRNLRDTEFFLVVVVMLGAGLAAVPGAVVAAAAFGENPLRSWLDWWIADACGMLILTPFLLEWLREGQDRLRNPDVARLLEGGIAFSLMTAAYFLVVHPATGTDRIHHSYLLIPFLIWIVLRLETLGTVTVNLALAIGVGFHAVTQPGLPPELLRDLTLQTQLFSSILAGSMLLLGAAFSERLQKERELRSLNESLERQVRERTQALEGKAVRLAESYREQRRLVGELQAANAELDAFSWSVSHDLRAPLRAVSGLGIALREDFGDRLGDRGKAYLDRIADSVSRMELLIDGLMALARVSRSEMRRMPLDLAQTAREVAAELAVRFPDRRVRFHAPPSVPAEADPRMARLLFDNLLGNAWKFSSVREEATVEFGVEEDSGRPVLFVRDDGVGFDMAYAGELFAPFRRLHPEGEFPGTGIGLATVRRIVSRHGGWIRAEGRPGAGATVRFTIPPHPVGANGERRDT